MNEAQTAATRTLAPEPRVTYHTTWDEDGLYEVLGYVNGQAVVLELARFRSDALARAEAAMAEYLAAHR